MFFAYFLLHGIFSFFYIWNMRAQRMGAYAAIFALHALGEYARGGEPPTGRAKICRFSARALASLRLVARRAARQRARGEQFRAANRLSGSSASFERLVCRHTSGGGGETSGRVCRCVIDVASAAILLLMCVDQLVAIFVAKFHKKVSRRHRDEHFTARLKMSAVYFRPAALLGVFCASFGILPASWSFAIDSATNASVVARPLCIARKLDNCHLHIASQ